MCSNSGRRCRGPECSAGSKRFRDLITLKKHGAVLEPKEPTREHRLTRALCISNSWSSKSSSNAIFCHGDMYKS